MILTNVRHKSETPASRPLAVMASLMVASLVAIMPWHEARAQIQQHQVDDDRLEQLADQLVSMIDDDDRDGSCSFYLAEMTESSGSLLTQASARTIEAWFRAKLDARWPSTGCDVAYGIEPAGTEAGDIAKRLSDSGRPSIVYTMSYFPRLGNGLMLLATAYRPNARFAAFSGQINLETSVAALDQPSAVSDDDVTTALSTEPAATQAAEAPAEEASAEEVPSTDLTATAPEDNETPPAAESPSAALQPLDGIGSAEEIEAIKAMKFGVMPKTTKTVTPPPIGLRIDVGGAAPSGMAKMTALARTFLQNRQPASAEPLELDEENGVIRVRNQPDAELQGIEIVNSDPASAFDELFSGEVDLVLSAKPISQEQYDRFTEAFGVDMRSGAGETVIGVEAVSLVVHPSNQLPSVTKEAAAEIFSNSLTTWDEATLSQSGLTGPIQTLAVMRGAEIRDGYSVTPDKVLGADETIAELVSLDPQSIGYGNLPEQGDLRSLSIEECGMVYTADDFYMRTEDHPLARRVFLYSNPAKGNQFRNAFLYFVTSEEGQELVADYLVNLQAAVGGSDATSWRLGVIKQQNPEQRSNRERLVGLIEDARRLSTTFRFRFDSDQLRLDQSAARDLANLIKLSQAENVDPGQLLVLGFADSDGNVEYNMRLSLERAEAIAKRLVNYGVPVPPENVMGFGEDAPIACNERPDGTADELGKARNRRVEVWLLNSAS